MLLSAQLRPTALATPSGSKLAASDNMSTCIGTEPASHCPAAPAPRNCFSAAATPVGIASIEAANTGLVMR
eukprot:scaffold20328_cov116-Isochrysis_galbana.AAC.4